MRPAAYEAHEIPKSKENGAKLQSPLGRLRFIVNELIDIA
jgi:hypothetical protein